MPLKKNTRSSPCDLLRPEVKKFLKEFRGSEDDLAEIIVGEEQGAQEGEEETPRVEEEQEAVSSTARKQSLRFNKDARLERVDSSEPASSIIRGRKGTVEAIRETEFDKGDADVFWEVRQVKGTARRGGSKRGVSRKGTRRKATSKDGSRENSTDDEAPQVDAESSTNNGKGKERQVSQQAKNHDMDDFEVKEGELLFTQKEAERKTSERRRRKHDAEQEQEQSQTEAAGPSTSTQDEEKEKKKDGEGAESCKPKKKTERSIVYKYATGGNQRGRVPWSTQETECLLTDLEILHPRYEEALQTNVRFAVWSEIVKRHGENGTLSTVLKGRNNVQLKDKARNEFERRRRAKQEIPKWLEHYG